MHLTVVLTDFFPVAAELTGGALPRLPGFEWLLQHGRASRCAADPRHELVRGAQPSDGALRVSAAALLQRLARRGTHGGCWIASPVHLQAALDHLRLHRAGLLHLTATEQELLVADFARVFAGAQLELTAVAGTFVLGGAVPTTASTQDPAALLGADLSGSMAGGEGGAQLRRIGAELEMWLHDHAVSAARANRGALPVNALWLWGGEPAAGFAPATADSLVMRTHVFSADAIVTAICDASGRPAQRPAAGYGAWRSQAATQAHCTVTLSAAPVSARDAPLPRLDADWFVPAAHALRAGELRGITLLAGGARRDVHHGALRRHIATLLRPLQRWSPPRPWWENFGDA